jgi:adenylate cyclase
MIHLQTFGTAELRSDSAQVRSVLTQPRRLALLVYLAVAEPRGLHPRERLLALFWPESDTERGRNALRQGLHYLRRSLGDGVIVVRGDDVGVDPERLRCDARVFEAAISAGRPAEALDLYGGEFLPGLFVDDAPGIERWMEDRRAHYRGAAAEAARAAAAAEEGRGGLGAAVLLVRRALAIEPHDEATLAHLITLHGKTGDRAAAVRDFEAFAKRLDADLGLEPAPANRRVLQGVLEGEAGDAQDVGDSAGGSGSRGDEWGPTGSGVQEGPAVPEVPRQPAQPVKPAVPPGAPSPRPRRPVLWTASVALLTLVAALVAVYAGRPPDVGMTPSPGGTPAPGDMASVAVLPFVNMSGDPERDFLSDGMAEEVTTALARIPELRVVARTSAFRFREERVGVDSIARALRASHLVEGSVREDAGTVRVTAQLVDGRTGYRIWAGTFQGASGDLFAMQDSIARAVVTALEPLFGFSFPRTGPARSPDPEAHNDFLRGRSARARDTPDGIRLAEEYFRRAVERDPAYARPWAGLAEVRTVDSYRRLLPQGEGYEDAEALAERALELDPGLADPHVVLGRLAAEHSWDFDDAEHHFRRALELEPGNVLAMRGLARLLVHVGRSDEALELSRRALERDPVSPVAHRWLGTAYMLAGEHARAVEVLVGVMELDPDNLIASVSLALSLGAQGRHDEAVRAAEHALQGAPDEQLYIAHAAAIHAAAGDAVRARELLARLEASPLPAAYYRAMILGALGDADGAIRELDRAIEARESLLVQLGAIPSFDPLRRDPRFEDILRRVGVRR